jgi:hypothetical protein
MWPAAGKALLLVASMASLGNAQGVKSVPLAESSPLATSSAQAESPTLVLGDAYTFEVKRGDAKQTFGGNLVKTTEQWIVLRRISSGKNESGIPILSAIPKLGNMFRQAHEGLVEDDLWIPRDAAAIESHMPVSKAAKMKPVLGTEPPTRFRCAMTLAENNEVVRRSGNLAAINEKGVTLLSSGSMWSNQSRAVPRANIMCISISNYVSDIRMTHRSEQD